ncbi:MAG: cob(I)yrinic acid a,c-diamide adenosyltransferase [Thermoanaerobacteraceae bacterium]|nr:cob(I)yrinic acid a,c-diamide adenosyltransferase [Thermoanaerobacteraceae bacterium]
MAGLKCGLVQVYTGDGKGKTTAAFGLALRAAGHGLKVVIVQFLKTADYGEHKALARLTPEIQVKAFGRQGFVRRQGLQPEDYERAREALSFAREVMLKREADILILDEINVALHFGLLSEEEVLALLETRPPEMELVLTGRGAPERIVAVADLVTEMRPLKHPYSKGVKARKGIEF